MPERKTKSVTINLFKNENSVSQTTREAACCKNCDDLANENFSLFRGIFRT